MRLTATFKAADVIKDYKQKAAKFPKALNSAINKTAAKSKTYVSKNIRAQYNIKAAELNKNFILKKSTWQTLQAELTTLGKGISFTAFGTKQPDRLQKGPSGKRRYLVKAKIKKASGKKVVRDVFSIRGKKTFFKMRGNKIVKAFAPGPATMFDDKSKDKANKFILLEFPPIFEHEIEYFYK